jgi:hypothetical protein
MPQNGATNPTGSIPTLFYTPAINTGHMTFLTGSRFETAPSAAAGARLGDGNHRTRGSHDDGSAPFARIAPPHARRRQGLRCTWVRRRSARSQRHGTGMVCAGGGEQSPSLVRDPGIPFLRSRPAALQSRRAQELSRSAVAPTFPRALRLPGLTLTAPSTAACSTRSG